MLPLALLLAFTLIACSLGCSTCNCNGVGRNRGRKEPLDPGSQVQFVRRGTYPTVWVNALNKVVGQKSYQA